MTSESSLDLPTYSSSSPEETSSNAQPGDSPAQQPTISPTAAPENLPSVSLGSSSEEIQGPSMDPTAYRETKATQTPVLTTPNSAQMSGSSSAASDEGGAAGGSGGDSSDVPGSQPAGGPDGDSRGESGDGSSPASDGGNAGANGGTTAASGGAGPRVIVGVETIVMSLLLGCFIL